jgi:serine/threonine protein kinase
MDKDGAPKLSDLGLVIVQGDGSLTQAGFAVGTPHYMSPEQSRGDKDIDHRADIYALGCTLYHAATGRTPFDGPTPAVLMVKHINEKIPHPQSVNPDLSDEFCMVLERMMTRGKEERYANCHDAARDLELLVEGEAPQCDPLPANKSNFIPLAKTAAASKPRIPNPKMSARLDKRTSNAALTPPREHKPQWPMLVAIGVSSLLLTVGVVKYFGIGAPAAQPVEPPPKETKKSPEPPLPEVKPSVLPVKQTDPSAATPKTPPGAVLLFNGVDLTGWREISPKWMVENGALVSIGETTSSTLSCAQKLPADFELTFSIKLKGAFHMAWGCRGSAANDVLMHNNKNYVSLEKYNPMSDGLNTPIGNTVKESSEPRRYRIVHRGKKIEVYIDEVLAVSSDKGGAAPPGASRTLMLYAHQDSIARFCDVAVRDLGDTPK